VRLHRASISLSNEKASDDVKTRCNKRKIAITVFVLKILASTLVGVVTTTLFFTLGDIKKVFLSAVSFSPALYFAVNFVIKVLPELLESKGTRILNQVQGFETYDRPDFSEKTGFMGEVDKEVKYLFDFLRTTHVRDDKIKRSRPIRLAVFVDDWIGVQRTQ
jgi:hypothetical protein